MNKRLNKLINLPFFEAKNLQNKPKIGPSCVICGREQGKRKLARDHCHATGINRGLLCHQCNAALGLLNDDIEVMRNAINYLKHYGKLAA
ncbi:MAG: endonuclease domain-containing protein [Gallionella sp.]